MKYLVLVLCFCGCSLPAARKDVVALHAIGVHTDAKVANLEREIKRIKDTIAAMHIGDWVWVNEEDIVVQP